MSIFEDDSEEKLIICEDNKAYRLRYNIKGRLLSKEAITMDGTPCNCKGSFILSKEAHSFRGGSVRRFFEDIMEKEAEDVRTVFDA